MCIFSYISMQHTYLYPPSLNDWSGSNIEPTNILIYSTRDALRNAS